MPISIDEFENESADDLLAREQSLDAQVLEFLAYNPDQAYARREINGSVDASIFELASTLARLEEEGLVRHKGTYWLITEHGMEVARQ